MREQVDNVFTYYRGPSARGSKRQLGKQLEDNATAALLKTIDEVHRTESVAADEMLRTLVDEKTSIPDGAEVDCNDQVSVSDITTSGRDVLLVGLSPSGLDLASIEDSEDENTGGLVDGVIRIGDSTTLVLEVKTQADELTNEELEKYATELGIDLKRYHKVTWSELAETVSNLKSEEYHPVADFLLDEFYEFIELTTLNRIVAAAYWEEDGEYKYKRLTLRYRESMNRRTQEAHDEDIPPRVSLEFNADGYKPISFSAGEWKAAVEQFPDEIQTGFVEGQYEPFISLMEERGRTTLAEVGDSDGVHKIIEINPDKDRIAIQSKTSEYNSHYINRPTFHESDFNMLYTDEEVENRGTLPFLEPNGQIAEALFREGDLLKASPFDIDPKHL